MITISRKTRYVFRNWKKRGKISKCSCTWHLSAIIWSGFWNRSAYYYIMDYSYGSSSILGFYRYWKSVFLKNFCATLEWFIRAKYFAISRTWLIMLQNYLFGQYSRVSNKHRLLNKSSLNFYITILIHFYINLGIAVIFWFFFFINIFKKNLIYKQT